MHYLYMEFSISLALNQLTLLGKKICEAVLKSIFGKTKQKQYKVEKNLQYRVEVEKCIDI